MKRGCKWFVVCWLVYGVYVLLLCVAWCLYVQCSLFVVSCSLCVVCCGSFGCVCCLLLDVCLLFLVCCVAGGCLLLLADVVRLVNVSCWPLVVWCMSFAVCYLHVLFVVCRLLFVV